MRRNRPPEPSMEDRLHTRAKTGPRAIHGRNADREQFGVPRWLRRLNRRYGRIGKFQRGGNVVGIVKMHSQNPAPKLDHWDARTNGKRPKPPG